LSQSLRFITNNRVQLLSVWLWMSTICSYSTRAPSLMAKAIPRTVHRVVCNL
jgi:hypothetical protein